MRGFIAMFPTKVKDLIMFHCSLRELLLRASSAAHACLRDPLSLSQNRAQSGGLAVSI